MRIETDLPVIELLAGLAEESAELAQAALKLRRAYDGTNPTPMTEEDAYDDLLEEIADVELYLDQLSINKKRIEEIKGVKGYRWQKRLGMIKNENEADASGCAAADLPDGHDQLRTATERSGLHHHDQPGQDAHHPHG